MGITNVICACSLGLSICVFTFRMVFELRGWPPQLPTFSSNSTKITKNAKFKLQFSHVGGCGGQPIHSKSILKVKTQIPIPKEHAQITFLNPIDCFLSQITIYNFPICPGSPCTRPT